MMRTWIRWFLLLVLVMDAALAAVLLTGVLPMPAFAAETETATDPTPAEGETGPSRDALALLGRELTARSEALRLREEAVEELLRSSEVAKRAAGPVETAAETAAESAEAPAEEAAPNEAFQRLLRAYENMEPESAASALAELAAMDPEAVLELLAGWQPRTSGQILDALTQTNPSLAADLSYRIWRRGGNNETPAASDDR